MKEKWVVSAKKADFQAIGQRFGIDPVLARIMRNRGLTDLQEMNLYLHGTRADLNDPHLLKDADLAAQILREKIKEKKRIRIIGDYDIDGIQSTYILYCALRRLGADADFVIPDRILDGYGLNEHLVTRASQDGIDTILTCDNGISAIDQIHLAKELGISMEETMAVGDSGNDAEMLKAAGLGVAMGNAVPEAKAVANEVCQDVINDGITLWLKEHDFI